MAERNDSLAPQQSPQDLEAEIIRRFGYRGPWDRRPQVPITPRACLQLFCAKTQQFVDRVTNPAIRAFAKVDTLTPDERADLLHHIALAEAAAAATVERTQEFLAKLKAGKKRLLRLKEEA